jgi:hypothetical protein
LFFDYANRENTGDVIIEKTKLTRNPSPHWNPLCVPEIVKMFTWMPCSKQYNSQQALPIWQPA